MMGVAEALRPLSSHVSLFSVAILAIVAFNLIKIIYNVYLHPLSKLPGPRSWAATRVPFLSSLIRGKFVHDMEKLHRQYGPIIRISPNEVTFARPDAWKDIYHLRADHQQFLKDPLWWGVEAGTPKSLLSALEPAEHAPIRKVLMPGFTTGALKDQEPNLHFYVNLLVERIKEQAEKLRQGDDAAATVDMAPWFNFTTFDIFGDLGFGESFNCLQDSKYHPWIALLFNSVKFTSFIISTRYYPWIMYLLGKLIPASLKKMAANHRQQIADKVQRRLNFELERPDIMSHVIKAKYQLPTPVVNSTFMVLTTAGSETTATALCGTLNYLVANPRTLALLEEEVRGAFAKDADITLDSLRALPYLNAVIKEGLRLCPPIPWMLPRCVPPGGDTVCGVWLPGGTPVSIQAYAMHRNPEYFHDSRSYAPERWLPEAAEPGSPFASDRRDAVQPFSAGPRSCMGVHLAWAEMRLILAKLVWHFDFAAADEDRRLRWEDLRTFLLVEKKPVEVRVKARRPAL